MPNVSEKKKKLLYLAQILLEKTDSEHTLTLPELLQELESRGISAERKSVYDDIETLRSVGMKIDTRKNKTFQYYVEQRLFTPEELELLVQSVREARLVPEKQGESIAERLATLCSAHQAARVLQAGAAPAKESVKRKGEEKITLEFSSSLLDAVSERFGPGLSPEPVGKNRLRITARTDPGPALFAWLFSQGTEVKLTAPKKLAEQFRERAKAAAKLYKS